MKRIILTIAITLTACLGMSAQHSIQEQHERENSFDRIVSYVEVTSDQMKPVSNSFQQLTLAMEVFSKETDPSKLVSGWNTIRGRHLNQMKEILTPRQFERYKNIFELTVNNSMQRLAANEQ